LQISTKHRVLFLRLRHAKNEGAMNSRGADPRQFELTFRGDDMLKSRAARNGAFVLIIATTVLAFQTGVLASMGSYIGEWCNGWGGEHDGECWIGDGFPPGWSAHGNIDLSEMEEPELEGAALCNGLWDACDDECLGLGGTASPYASYVADYMGFYMSQADPCYSAATDPECYDTWGDASCDAGPSTTWSCSCHAFMFCECG
jgi:hypothetical protein